MENQQGRNDVEDDQEMSPREYRAHQFLSRPTMPTNLPDNIKDWRINHVLDWLGTHVCLPEYKVNFARMSIDGLSLLTLNDYLLLHEVQIQSEVHRAKLVEHIKALQEQRRADRTGWSVQELGLGLVPGLDTVDGRPRSARGGGGARHPRRSTDGLGALAALAPEGSARLAAEEPSAFDLTGGFPTADPATGDSRPLSREQSTSEHVPADYLYPFAAKASGPSSPAPAGSAGRSPSKRGAKFADVASPELPYRPANGPEVLAQNSLANAAGSRWSKGKVEALGAGGRIVSLNDNRTGRGGDVLLGVWTCCQSVDPQAPPCRAFAGGHTQAEAKCANCGVFFRTRDGHPGPCAHHAAPEPAVVNAYGACVWPCCGTYGLRESKYALDRTGAGTGRHGCVRSAHLPEFPQHPGTCSRCGKTDITDWKETCQRHPGLFCIYRRIRKITQKETPVKRIPFDTAGHSQPLPPDMLDARGEVDQALALVPPQPLQPVPVARPIKLRKLLPPPFCPVTRAMMFPQREGHLPPQWLYAQHPPRRPLQLPLLPPLEPLDLDPRLTGPEVCSPAPLAPVAPAAGWDPAARLPRVTPLRVPAPPRPRPRSRPASASARVPAAAAAPAPGPGPAPCPPAGARELAGSRSTRSLPSRPASSAALDPDPADSEAPLAPASQYGGDDDAAGLARAFSALTAEGEGEEAGEGEGEGGGAAPAPAPPALLSGILGMIGQGRQAAAALPMEGSKPPPNYSLFFNQNPPSPVHPPAGPPHQFNFEGVEALEAPHFRPLRAAPPPRVHVKAAVYPPRLQNLLPPSRIPEYRTWHYEMRYEQPPNAGDRCPAPPQIVRVAINIPGMAEQAGPNFPVCDFHCLRRTYNRRLVSVFNRTLRPVKVGPGRHFAEAPKQLRFDREYAWGFRLRTATVFPARTTTDVELIPAEDQVPSKGPARSRQCMVPVSFLWKDPDAPESRKIRHLLQEHCGPLKYFPEEPSGGPGNGVTPDAPLNNVHRQDAAYSADRLVRHPKASLKQRSAQRPSSSDGYGGGFSHHLNRTVMRKVRLRQEGGHRAPAARAGQRRARRGVTGAQSAPHIHHHHTHAHTSGSRPLSASTQQTAFQSEATPSLRATPSANTVGGHSMGGATLGYDTLARNLMHRNEPTIAEVDIEEEELTVEEPEEGVGVEKKKSAGKDTEGQVPRLPKFNRDFSGNSETGNFFGPGQGVRPSSARTQQLRESPRVTGQHGGTVPYDQHDDYTIQTNEITGREQTIPNTARTYDTTFEWEPEPRSASALGRAPEGNMQPAGAPTSPTDARAGQVPWQGNGSGGLSRRQTEPGLHQMPERPQSATSRPMSASTRGRVSSGASTGPASRPTSASHQPLSPAPPSQGVPRQRFAARQARQRAVPPAPGSPGFRERNFFAAGPGAAAVRSGPRWRDNPDADAPSRPEADDSNGRAPGAPRRPFGLQAGAEGTTQDAEIDQELLRAELDKLLRRGSVESAGKRGATDKARRRAAAMASRGRQRREKRQEQARMEKEEAEAVWRDAIADTAAGWTAANVQSNGQLHKEGDRAFYEQERVRIRRAGRGRFTVLGQNPRTVNQPTNDAWLLGMR